MNNSDPRPTPFDHSMRGHRSSDQAASLERRREHYIPLRKTELVRVLAQRSGLSNDHQDAFTSLCHILSAIFHYEFNGRLQALKDLYAPLDPDSDVQQIEPHSPEQHDEQIEELFSQFHALMERANFVRLNDKELKSVIGGGRALGIKLDVDLSVFERLEVFARGDTMQRRVIRRWQNLYRQEEIEVPTYQRLVVILRLRGHQRIKEQVDPRVVYIKNFKDIPHADLEMLLPGSRVRMTLFDRVRILVPTMGGITITLVKVVNAIVAAAYMTVVGAFAFVGLMAGTIGYGVKSFFGFLRTKQKYQLNLTKNLYFQNLDNNSGVLFRLLDEAEEQEFREAVLAYYLLWREAGAEGWSQQELDARAESFLADILNLDVDFEIDDALNKLLRLALAERKPDGRLVAVSIEQALMRLDTAWDNYFHHANSPAPIPSPHASAKAASLSRRSALKP